MFCAIVAGDEDADVVLDVDAAVAFLDRSPLFKGHVLVVPRVHVVTLPELDPVGPFFEAVQLVSADPGGTRFAGDVRGDEQHRQPERPALPCSRRAANRGDGLRGFFWPRSKYAPGESAEIAARRAELA